MRVSIGVMAYNEQANIGRLLKRLVNEPLVDEIIVVASGCTDNTVQIAQGFGGSGVRTCVQERREGKASAVNLFMKEAQGDILVLESADTIPSRFCFKYLLEPFMDKSVGMVGAHPIPVDSTKTMMGKVAHLLWGAHHEMALIAPKAGEVCAFRNVVRGISPETPVDEACFPAETRVLAQKKYYFTTRRGEKILMECALPLAINKVNVGDNVLTFNEVSGEKEYKKVPKVFVREATDFITLKFSNGNELTCTPQHPVAVDVKGRIRWVLAKAIQTGDRCLQYKYRNFRSRLNGLKFAGRTFEEKFGVEKAKKIKCKLSISQKKHGRHSGHFPLGQIPWNKGLTKETDDRVAEYSRKGSIILGDGRRAGSKNANYGKGLFGAKNPMYGKSRKGNASETIKAIWADEKSVYNTPETRRRKSESAKRKWQDKEYREKTVKAVSSAQHARPNGLERALSYLLRHICPGEFRYNGDGRILLISRYVPDFVNVNGKKKVIEVFSRYWKEFSFGSVDRYKEVRERAFRRAGFETLFIEDKEFEDRNRLRNKVASFVYNPNMEIVEVIGVRRHTNQSPVKVYNLEVEGNNNYFVYGVLVHNCIEKAIVQEGYKVAYAPRAVVFNKGAGTVGDFLRQRKRIYHGHLMLRASGYEVPSMSLATIVKATLRAADYKHFRSIVISALLEQYARRGAIREYNLDDYRPTVWAMADTTKEVE